MVRELPFLCGTIPQLLASTGTFDDGRIALTDATGHLTFAELRHGADRLAASLLDRGVTSGSRVGTCMSSSLLQAVTVLGILRAGAVLVPILPRLKPANVRHIATHAGLFAVVADSPRREEAATTGLPVWSPKELVDGSALFAVDRTIESDLAAIIYSSGSTGRPKGIMVTHRNLVDGARITADYLGTRSEDRIGGLLSLDFDYGLNQLWQVLLTGASLHLHSMLLPRDTFSWLEASKVTVLPLMPAVISRLFDDRLNRGPQEITVTSVRQVCSSGGSLTDSMIAHVRDVFPSADLYPMYGLTEAFRSTFLAPQEVKHRPRSIGKAIPQVEILVLDENGDEVEPGAIGELVHRGGCVARGYWRDPEATASRFRQLDRFPGQTFVFSGDRASRDENGFLYFHGRLDAMIKTSGYRVSPTEVEEVAETFPGLTTAVATGRPDDALGQTIHLVFTSGAPVSVRDLTRHLRRELPSYMVPTRLTQVETLPVTGNGGKVDRVRISELVLSGSLV